MELSIIQNKIYEIRGVKVMLDFDLAGMYQVETRVLNQSVKRNIERFPDDFMFQLSKDEWENLKSQFVTSSWGGTRKLPYVFTEQGVAQLSSVLSSTYAIEVNINIIRAFVAIRNYLISQAGTSKEIKALWLQVKMLEERSEENLKAMNDMDEDNQKSFDEIYLALSELAARQKNISEPKARNPVGYIKSQKTNK